MPVQSILVIEDEETISNPFVAFLKSQDFSKVKNVATFAEAEKMLLSNRFDLIFLDVNLPDGLGVDLIPLIQKESARLDPQRKSHVIMLSGIAASEMIVKCMQQGAIDYITKPFTLDVIKERIKRVDALIDATSIDDSKNESSIVGESNVIKNLRAVVKKIAPVSATVLIHGGSGTGKELVAREIYKNSNRATMPFVAFNCAVLQETLFESELFGHEKGSFTGAISQRIGRFEEANGGTILLDEISEMSTNLQAKLLRVLQEGTFERVGSNITRHVDVRVIATTNRDLTLSVKKGEFREDLYHRLAVVPVRVPLLHERGDDILVLATHFLKTMSKKYGYKSQAFTQSAKDGLMAYTWPGNVRELKNCIERAVIFSHNEPVIDLPVMPVVEVSRLVHANEDQIIHPIVSPPLKKETSDSLFEAEKKHVFLILEKTGGHRKMAADRLGITDRALRYKLRKYGTQHPLGEASR